MTEEEWAYFLASGEPQIAAVTRLAPELCTLLKSPTNIVTIHHFYALKCSQKHGMEITHFPMLPITLECGMAISDKPGRLTFFYWENVVFGKWFKASVKLTREEHELWLMTFHVLSIPEVHRLCRKHKIIREQIL